MGERVRLIGAWKGQFETPLTGVTIDMTNTQLIIVPAGTIAALTVNLPTDPYDGEEVGINMTQVITTLTIQSAGKTVANPMTAGTVGGFCRFKYREASTTWYRIG